ncbi:uncharacterized protein RJT21DRAFT_116123 [Scheffersomyces amazonensis]|uniref:uncharacterized protein n=1 Tax=Scheffersomyces amazonensis TaxID=1078765 RepID=UPI00315C866A
MSNIYTQNSDHANASNGNFDNNSDYSYTDADDIFEFNINEEDEDLSSVSTSIPDSPLLTPKYYTESNYSYQPNGDWYDYEENEKFINYSTGSQPWLYECGYCKMKTTEANHKCVEANAHNDSLDYNNELIQSNYRKWLFSISPN